MKNLIEYTKSKLHFNLQTFTMESVASGAHQTWHHSMKKKNDLHVNTTKHALHFPFNDDGDGDSNVTGKMGLFPQKNVFVFLCLFHSY
jgi:hypothetical protein